MSTLVLRVESPTRWDEVYEIWNTDLADEGTRPTCVTVDHDSPYDMGLMIHSYGTQSTATIDSGLKQIRATLKEA